MFINKAEIAEFIVGGIMALLTTIAFVFLF